MNYCTYALTRRLAREPFPLYFLDSALLLKNTRFREYCIMKT